MTDTFWLRLKLRFVCMIRLEETLRFAYGNFENEPEMLVFQMFVELTVTNLT